MECSDYKIKLKTLFDKLLHDKFELSAEQTENLLRHLDGNNDKCVARIVETPFFANLLLHAFKNVLVASISVKIFFARLMRSVLYNEVLFNRFVQMQGFDLLVLRGEAKRYAGLMNPGLHASTELHQAMVQLAFAVTSHYSGVKFFVDTKIYHESLKAAMYEVIAKLIWQLNEYEEEAALLEVLQFVVNPLHAWTLTQTTVERQSCMDSSESVLPFVHTLVNMLGEVEHLVVPNNVVPMLMQEFSIESKLATALEATREPTLSRLLAEASVRYYFAASRQLALRCPESETRVNQDFHTAFEKIMTTLTQKRSYVTVLQFLSQCHVFWHKVESVGAPIEIEMFNNKYLLQNQFILLLMIPLFVKHRRKRLVSDPFILEACELFHSDLALNFPPNMIRPAYELRDLIIESTGIAMLPACMVMLRELLRLKRLLSRQQACLMFQTLYYALSEFVLSDGSDLVLLANPLATADDERYLAHILDAIAMLLDEHDINWNESLEIVELQAALINLIKQNILPVELLVQTVDLITRSVRKLLSPELALLKESRRGGSLREAARAARALLARPEPAARAAVLRLAHSFLEIAYVKFTPLRAVISAHGLVMGAAKCALRDSDARAQAAALRCLADAARCEDLWTELLAHCHNLYEQLVSIMRYSPEGEVRKEAANVLTHVYINRKVTAVFTRHVSHAMGSAATEDPHWPVRLAALDFWKQLMTNQFTDRGVIDGKFPEVTFCKEKRKIIVMNDKEIQKQLEIGMNHLSTTGCLGVLLKCMDSNNNRGVIEKAYKFTKRLVETLDQYKYSGMPSAAQISTVTADKGQAMSQSTDVNDILMDIFECLGSDRSGSECMSPIEVIQPSTFVKVFREIAEKRPPKVDLGTVIDDIVTSVIVRSV